MRNNSAQYAEDEREIKYFGFRTFGAAAPRLRPPRRVPAAIIGRACDTKHHFRGVTKMMQRNSLPTRKERRLRRREVYLPKGVRNVSEAFRDTRIMRGRHAR